jgi:aspartate/methionine/tyrosine aminotransferase
LRVAGYLFVDKGDKIITPDLFWGNYKLIFQNAYEAELAKFGMFDNGKFNVRGLKESLGNGKNIILLNFPNNPSGYTPTNEEVEQIVSIIKEHAEKGNKIVAIIDDAYFGLLYKDGIFKESIFAKLCNLHENVLAVKIDGATKEDYVWGFRIGFITFGCRGMGKEAYAALEQKAAGAVRGSISNAPHISQSLVLNAFSSETYDAEKKEKYEILKSRFEEVEKVLANHPEYMEEFEPLPFNSGYFMCIRTKKDAEKVRQKLLEKYDTGIISFGSDVIRIAFSSVKNELIAELFDNIYKASKEV